MNDEQIVLMSKLTKQNVKEELITELDRDDIDFENVDYLISRLKEIQNTINNFSK